MNDKNIMKDESSISVCKISDVQSITQQVDT